MRSPTLRLLSPVLALGLALAPTAARSGELGAALLAQLAAAEPVPSAPVSMEAEPSPGDKVRMRQEAIRKAAIQKIKAAGVVEVGNGLPVPAIRPTDNVETKEVHWDEAVNLRLLGHANEPLKLLMVMTGNARQDTRDEVRAVLDVVKEINEDAGMPAQRERLKLHLILDGEQTLREMDLTAEELRDHVEINKYFASQDIWLQDWGEIAAVWAEGATKERTVILDTNRGRGLAELPERLAKNWNGHFLKGPRGHGAGNYGGNIEVTPDDYLVIGDSSSDEIREMFSQLGYEGRIATLATRWLLVGHVDEYLSFLPTPETPLGYTLVKADPTLGMELLKKSSPRAFETSLFEMTRSAFRYANAYPEMLSIDGPGFTTMFDRVGALHSGAHGTAVDLGGIDSATLEAQNAQAAEIIDEQVAKLIAFLQEKHGPDMEVPVVSVPTLFHEMRGGRYAALTPGVANMVVLRKHLIIPDPLLPEFQDHLRLTLPKVGFKPRLVPNLTYHIGVGQLHCGTNTFRHPNRYVHPRYKEAAERRLAEVRRKAGFRSVHGD